MHTLRLLGLFLLAFVLYGCPTNMEEDWPANPNTVFFPRLMERSAMEELVKFEAAQPLKTPGKLFHYRGYIFLNERYEGIHIIDNRNRENPTKLGFFRIPGNLDLLVKDNRLYADNTHDLLTIDVQDPANPQLVARTRNVFPELPPPDLENVPAAYRPENRPENTVIVAWTDEP